MENSPNENYNRGTLISIENENYIELKDDYDHNDNSIEYIIENELMPDNKTDSYKQLKELYNQIYTKACLCCENNNCSKTIECCHYQNYILSNNELVLNKTRLSNDLIYECSNNCECPTTCWNRLVQFGPREHLKISEFYDLNKQLGLISLENIPEGGFVCEYIGEILTKDEAIRRSHFNDKKNQMNYIICLNETCSDGTSKGYQTFIDPSLRGNIGRYLNHSCDPNCEIISVRTDGIIPKLGIFTKRNIKKFEELCFDYGCNTEEEQTNVVKSINRKMCYCQSFKCRKYLPNFSY